MLWITFGLALLLSGGALAYVLWPIVGRDVPLLPVEDDRLTDLLARKDRALRSIKELEFDHQVGKLDEEDYQRFKYRLSQQAIALIKQVEKVAPATAEVDETIEAEIAQLRRVSATPAKTNGAATDVPTPSIAAKASADSAATTRPTEPTRFCTECGTKIEPTYKFCAGCGMPVAQTPVTQEG